MEGVIHGNVYVIYSKRQIYTRHIKAVKKYTVHIHAYDYFIFLRLKAVLQDIRDGTVWFNYNKE
jgi:hypothetical protein